jgi:hypothetical protein
MYAVIEKNKLTISVAKFYAMDWYERDHFLSHEETYPFDYGRLEIDIHKNRRKYLTGFTLDPWLFIVDYLKIPPLHMRLKKSTQITSSKIKRT